MRKCSNAINIFSGIINGFQNSFINRKKNVDGIDQSKNCLMVTEVGKWVMFRLLINTIMKRKFSKVVRNLSSSFLLPLLAYPIYTIKIRDPKGR